MPKREVMEQCQAIELRSGKEILNRGERIKNTMIVTLKKLLIYNRERRSYCIERTQQKLYRNYGAS